MEIDREDLKIELNDGTLINAKLKKTDGPFLIVTHGVGEHLERHNYFLSFNNFTIFQYDLRGHGKSGGRRGYIESFSQYMEDLKDIISYLEDHHGMSNYMLFGHSMGALITAGFMQSFVDQNFYPKKVIINAPPISFDGVAGIATKILPNFVLRFLSAIPFGLDLAGVVDLAYLSHDPNIEKEYKKDELNCAKLNTRLIFNMVMAAKEIFSNPLNMSCPGVCTVGLDDHIVSVKAIEQYFMKVDSNIMLKTFSDAFHEVHNEIDSCKISYLDFLQNSFSEALIDL